MIPELLGVPPTGEPQAELWLGGHEIAPSVARTHAGPVPLDELVRGDPAAMLGADVVERFGPRLPYLLKVLAVERPLSIQAHPTRAIAEAGFAAENEAGLSRDARDRSYRDPFHKPELVVALTEFEALLGFRIPTDAEELIDELDVAGLDEAVELLRAPDGLAETVRWLLTLPAARTAELAAQVASGVRRRSGVEPFTRLARIAELFPGDPGILIALLLQPVHLRAGEAAAVPAGTPHCYLAGVVVEAQAASDNTLRAGLTAKHVDVPELLGVFHYDPNVDLRLTPAKAGGADIFELTRVPDFRLYRVRLGSEPVRIAGPRIVLVTDGSAMLSVDSHRTALGRGRSAFVPAERSELALTGAGTAFVVTPAL